MAGRFSFLFLIVLMAVVSSCSKESAETGEELLTINMVELSSEVVPSSFAPLAFYEIDGAVMIHYSNPDNEEYETFAFQNGEDQFLTMLVGDERIVISDGKASSAGIVTVSIMEADEGFLTLYVAELNTKNGELNVIERTPMTVNRAGTKADGDEFRFLLKEKLLDRIGDEVPDSDFFLALDFVTGGKFHVRNFASCICYLMSMAAVKNSWMPPWKQWLTDMRTQLSGKSLISLPGKSSRQSSTG